MFQELSGIDTVSSFKDAAFCGQRWAINLSIRESWVVINVMKKTKSSMIENTGADEGNLRLDSLNNFSKRVVEFELYLNNEEAKHTETPGRKRNPKRASVKPLR